MTVLVVQDGHAHGPFPVEHLSADRVMLVGAPPREIAVGDATVVLAGADGRLMRVPGHIADDSDSATGRWQISFRSMDRGVARRLDRWATQQSQRAGRPCVVVLDGSGLGRSRLRRDVCQLGRDIVFFENMLEFVWFMEDAAAEVGVVLVDVPFVQANGIEVLAFVRDRWSDKRCFLVCNQSIEEGQEARVRTLRLFVHGALRRPWTIRRLTVALGLEADPSAPRRRLALVGGDDPVWQTARLPHSDQRDDARPRPRLRSNTSVCEWTSSFAKIAFR